MHREQEPLVLTHVSQRRETSPQHMTRHAGHGTESAGLLDDSVCDEPGFAYRISETAGSIVTN